MPRKTLFLPIERASLLSLPETEDERNRHYTYTETNLSLIRQRRGDANRLGFAVQLCLLRYPGQGLQVGEAVEEGLLEWIARPLKIKTTCWPQYSSREATRLDHLLELRDMRVFLDALALQTDKAITLAVKALEEFRRQKVQVPSLNLVERLCAEAMLIQFRTRLIQVRGVYLTMTTGLSSTAST